MSQSRHPHHLPAPAPDARRSKICCRGYEPHCEMDFDLVWLRPGDRLEETSPDETAWLLLSGSITLAWDCGPSVQCRRESLFDQNPYCLHLPPGTPMVLQAVTECELARFATDNIPNGFPATLFTPDSMLESEDRGKGLLDDASWRIVRTIFDGRNRPGANLVLGEVVTLPGRWSSYPPHHHPQPEIYHYRFDDPRGYGHAELGEAVVKVRHMETTAILDQNDHSQVAAPGYAMYYIWAIRHLPGAPYSVPTFTQEHERLRLPGVVPWAPDRNKQGV